MNLIKNFYFESFYIVRASVCIYQDRNVIWIVGSKNGRVSFIVDENELRNKAVKKFMSRSNVQRATRWNQLTG